MNETTKSSKRGCRIWLFRLFAVGFPLFLLLLVELGLRVAGTGYPTSFLVPHPTSPGYLVDNYKFAWRFFPKALARAPRPIVVQEAKRQGAFRICVFGGSAAMGDPEPAYGMPRVIEALLRNRFPDRQFEVINCAVTAINSHVVRDIARDCRRLRADAWVVYLGNNEVHGPFGAGTVFGRSDRPLWLNRLGLGFKSTKIGQLLGGQQPDQNAPKNWGGMKMFLDQRVAHDDPRLQKVYADFETNLTAIVKTAGAETEVILGTVACNQKDFPPFVSQHSDTLSDADLDAWNQHFAEGCESQSGGKLEAALESFGKARAIEPAHYAELWYRTGQVMLALGMTGEPPNEPNETAKVAFGKAADLDSLRFRADQRINTLIRNVAERQSVALVDADRVLIGDNGILGDEHFYEHVHFNFAGNYLLGKAFARELALKFGLVDKAQADRGWLTKDKCASQLGHSPFHERLTLVDVRGRLSSPPFSQQMGHVQRDARLQAKMQELSSQMTPQAGQATMSQYKQLIEQRPNDWLLRQQYALLLDSIGRQAAAAEQFEAIAEHLPHNAEAQFRLGAQYNRLKQRDDAETALRKAIELRPDFVRAYNSLGICMSHQDRAHESYRQFSKAVELQPSFAEAYVNWALVLAANGDTEGSMEKYKLAIEADANYLKAHAELGKHYVGGNNYQDAMPHYEAIARLLPNDAGAQLNLGMLYLKFGGHDEKAQQQFERTLELSPGNAQALEGLRRLP